jgi:hypothetical protein
MQTSEICYVSWVTNLIEAYIKIGDASNGRIIVKMNGIIKLDVIGNTKGGGYTTMNAMALGPCGLSGFGRGYWDNVVIDTANWIGKTHVAGLKPNAAGYSAQWTPSTGNNWDCVDEVPAVDTDFVSTNTVGHVDTYGLGDLPSDAAAVRSIQVGARAMKEGAATPQNLNLAVRTTGGDYYSSDKLIPTSFGALSHIWENNPGTSNPWTVSEVNAMEAGIKAAT